MKASGSKVFTISSKKRPRAWACTRKTSLAQRVALFRQAADEFGCLVEIYSRQFVTGISWQKIRQDIFFDGGERAERLEVAGASAIALRIDAGGSGDALIRNQDVAEFSAESVFAFHYIAVEDDAAAVACADDAGDRSLAAVGAEDGVVSPERGGVGVVQIGDGFAEFAGQAFADVESGPVGMNKVGGASSAELACGAGGAGGVEADGDYVVEKDARFFGGEFQSVCDLLQADVGSLFCECGMLEEPLDEELFLLVQQGVVDGGSAQIDSGHDLHNFLLRCQ